MFLLENKMLNNLKMVKIFEYISWISLPLRSIECYNYGDVRQSIAAYYLVCMI